MVYVASMVLCEALRVLTGAISWTISYQAGEEAALAVSSSRLS